MKKPGRYHHFSVDWPGESFRGTLRDECLNVHWFDDLTDAQRKLQAWQREYNETRPHRSLNELSPQEFKAFWTERTSEIR